jgi:cardiolipin synthase
LSRVAGAPLIGGNRVELLIDAQANFTRWLDAIQGARTSILFENYMFGDDGITRELRDALSERARAGVRVHVIRDWLGCIGESHDSFWDLLRAAGGEVRTFNPFRVTRPFGWLSRDHRKALVVDSDVAFVAGVCVDARWLGDPTRGIATWRDTGVAVHGPALREVALAFAETWAAMGDALPADLPVLGDAPPAAGDVDLRVIVTTPSTTGLYRLDQLFAAVAEKTLWLTDAYFVGTAPYVDALAAAAGDGVDVRLLVPATSDLPLVGAMSRAGYRALLEAGIRVYE